MNHLNYELNALENITTNKAGWEGQSKLRGKKTITSGSEITDINNYSSVLPDNLNIFRNYRNIEAVKNDNVKKQAIDFLLQFQQVLLSIKNEIEFSGHLPSLSILPDEDGPLLIEWIFKDFRLGFAFEENEAESSWYFVSNEKFGYANFSALLVKSETYEFLAQLLSIIMANL